MALDIRQCMYIHMNLPLSFFIHINIHIYIYICGWASFWLLLVGQTAFCKLRVMDLFLTKWCYRKVCIDFVIIRLFGQTIFLTKSGTSEALVLRCTSSFTFSLSLTHHFTGSFSGRPPPQALRLKGHSPSKSK